MDFDHARSLLADFALGLLDEDEAAEVAAWLGRSAELREEFAAYNDSAEALLLSAEGDAADAEVVERIAEGVRNRIATEQGLNRRAARSPMRAFAAVAALLLLAVGFGLAVSTFGRDDEDRSLRNRIESAALELPLHGDSANGRIYVAGDFGSGVVHLHGLAPAPENHHYELWSDGPAGAQMAASFQGSGDEQYVSLPALPRDMHRMFITVEADGRSAGAPRGPEVLWTAE